MAATAKKQRPQKTKGEFLSIQKIAFRCGLDRATCRKRLEAHGYKPEREEAKLKLYWFDAEMEAALTESQDKLTDVKIRKETAAAQLAELKVLQQNGELIAVSEVEDYLHRLFKSLHQEVCVRLPRTVSASMVKAKDAATAAKILSAALNRVFDLVRDNHGQLMIGKKKSAS